MRFVDSAVYMFLNIFCIIAVSIGIANNHFEFILVLPLLIKYSLDGYKSSNKKGGSKNG